MTPLHRLPEGVGHGSADVGPAEDSEWHANNGIEDGHNLPHSRLGGNVAVTWQYCPFILTRWLTFGP